MKWGIQMAVGLAVALQCGCDSDSPAEARPKEATREQPLLRIRVSDLYYGPRRACPRALQGLLKQEEIQRACSVRSEPVGHAGGSWCRWVYPQGSLVLMWAPSYFFLRRKFLEASPFLLSGREALLWETPEGVFSVVGALPDGSALILQAPRSLCSKAALQNLASRVLVRVGLRKLF